MKKKTGDDTAVSIDQLADDSSSSESDSDSESSASSSDDNKRQATAKAASKRKRTDLDEQEDADLNSSSDEDDSEDEETEDAPVRLPHAGPAVTIDEALKDPIYVPTSGDKKHGAMASKCILCEKASLKAAHLVEEHLQGKSHKRRMERFTSYTSEQMSPAERKSTDARDAVEDMDAWKEAKDLAEKAAAAASKPSKTAVKKEKLRIMRRVKKNEKRMAKKEKANTGGNRYGVESAELKKERKKRKYGEKKKPVKV